VRAISHRRIYASKSAQSIEACGTLVQQFSYYKASISRRMGMNSMDQRTPYSASPTDDASLRAEFNTLKDQVSHFIARAGNDAVRTAKQASSDVSDTAADLASSASEQTKTLVSELERVGRNNPLGALAGALLVGVLIGLIGRGRG
jgi:ElaB/YqjD/DUF883 family membrane-anchored ribosome-binding protein